MGNDLTPVIEIMTGLLLVTLVLSGIARGATKSVVVRSFSVDDYLPDIRSLSAFLTSRALVQHVRLTETLAFCYWTIDRRVSTDSPLVWEACEDTESIPTI